MADKTIADLVPANSTGLADQLLLRQAGEDKNVTVEVLHEDINVDLDQWKENLYPNWISDRGDGQPLAYPEGMTVNHVAQNWASNEDANQEEPGVGVKWFVKKPNELQRDGRLHDTLSGAKTRTDLTVGSQISIYPEWSGAIFQAVTGATPDEVDILAAANGLQLKRIKTTTSEWNALAKFRLNNETVASDGNTYKSTFAGVQSGNDPVTSPDFWVDPVSENTSNVNRRGKNGVFYDTPAAFVHRAGKITYSKSSTSVAELLTDLSKFMPAGYKVRGPGNLPPGLKAYYVSSLGDSQDGLSWATAYTSLPTALSNNDADVIFVRGGDRLALTQSLGLYTGSRDVAIISVGGRATMSPQRETTWVAGAQPNTYRSSALGGTSVQVLDPLYLDENGDRIPLTSVGSEALVSTTPGSWTTIGTGSSQQAVVRLFDSSVPDDDRAQVMRSSPNGFRGSNCKMYLYGFDFYSAEAGAFTTRGSDINSVIAVEDCGFYNALGDGFQVKGVGLAIAINCTASANSNDGFNYHTEGNVPSALAPHVIEIYCKGRHNLNPGTGNGSTTHEEVVSFRMGCDYFANSGPGIADINNAKSFNVCCTSNANRPDSNAWGAQIEGDAEGWFDGYVGDGNTTTEIAANGNGKLHYRDCYPVPESLGVGSSVDQDFS